MSIDANDQAKKENDRQRAEKRYQDGITAYNDGKLDSAIEALSDAEIRFRLASDFKRAADSRALIADVQRENSALEPAINSYQRAAKMYRDAGYPLLEANSTLSMGHIERQLSHLDRAQDAYQAAQQMYRAQQRNAQGLGNAALALGHIELQRGNTQYATEHYQEAMRYFNEAGDSIHEADASRSLADVERLARHFSAALDGYQLALEIYRNTRDQFGTIDALLGLGRIYLDQERLEQAADTFVDALSQANALEYELGQADANLGLAEVALLQGSVDQALIGAQSAMDLYTAQHNALGTAQSGRLLGEINLRRGQLSYANAQMERALRTFQSIAFKLGQAETAAGLGEIQFRRNSFERAGKTLQEARQLAQRIGNVQAASRALLTAGDLYLQEGQPGQARSAYEDARTHVETLGDGPVARVVAAAEVRLARLAIYAGDLKDAESHLASANAATERNPLAAQFQLQIVAARAQIYLIQGDFAQSAKYYSDTHNRAEAQQEPLVAADAILGMAQSYLARHELEAALETFLAVGRAYQLVESTSGDGSAALGAALLRFNQANDTPGQADALLTRGLAQRGMDENDAALTDFEQALKLYHQQRRPLGVADTRYARAGIFFQRGDLERARDEQTKAIAQVEHVMNSIASAQQWTLFLRQYAELYAQTAVTDIRLNRDEQARALLKNFARIAGTAELLQSLNAYENDLPTEGEELSEEEIRANTDLLRRIKQLSKSV